MKTTYKFKLCLLGATAVGKTSIFSRVVENFFPEVYHTTVGLVIKEKEWRIEDQLVKLIIFDLEGADDYQEFRSDMLLGSNGFFLVIDGTRKDTYSKALEIHNVALKTIKEDVPFVVLVNKSDLRESWEVSPADIEEMTEKGWDVVQTSAKENSKIEDAVDRLVQRIIELSS